MSTRNTESLVDLREFRSESCNRAIDAAKRFAEERKHEACDGYHFLLGTLQTCDAARRCLCVSPFDYERRMDELLLKGKSRLVRRALQFGPRLKAAFLSAARVYVFFQGIDPMWLAVLETAVDQSGFGGQLLQQCGVCISKVVRNCAGNAHPSATATIERIYLKKLAEGDALLSAIPLIIGPVI